MSSDEKFSDEDVADEIIDFVMAGAGTTQSVTQALIMHFADSKKDLQRVREEFEKARDEIIAQDPDAYKGLSQMEILRKVTTLDMVQDLEYTNAVIQEGLRIGGPAAQTGSMVLEKDIDFGNLSLKKGEKISVNVLGLHHNTKQWQRPQEYLPERFLTGHELSLTPDGKKRNPFSFFAFGAGRRICFGKTFAEYNLKFTLIYLT
jgi:cytochrome P450